MLNLWEKKKKKYDPFEKIEIALSGYTRIREEIIRGGQEFKNKSERGEVTYEDTLKMLGRAELTTEIISIMKVVMDEMLEKTDD